MVWISGGYQVASADIYGAHEIDRTGDLVVATFSHRVIIEEFLNPAD